MIRATVIMETNEKYEPFAQPMSCLAGMEVLCMNSQDPAG